MSRVRIRRPKCKVVILRNFSQTLTQLILSIHKGLHAYREKYYFDLKINSKYLKLKNAVNVSAALMGFQS